MTRRTALSLAPLAVLPSGSFAQTPFSLPKLAYSVDALEPFIDAKTMEIHHDKHHQAYVDNLNKALAGQPTLAGHPVDYLLATLDTLPEATRTAVRNNGGGHFNHSLLWQTLGKTGTSPKGKLATAITKSFKSQTEFEDKLRAIGMTAFGSGWVWVTPQSDDELKISIAPNQDSPWLVGKPPLFGLDVWEHAYYLKYQNRRADYLAALTKVLNWDFISARYEDLLR